MQQSFMFLEEIRHVSRVVSITGNINHGGLLLMYNFDYTTRDYQMVIEKRMSP